MNYVNEKIELFVELHLKGIDSQKLAGWKLWNEGRVDAARYINGLSHQGWCVGIFEAMIVKDDFKNKQEKAA